MRALRSWVHHSMAYRQAIHKNFSGEPEEALSLVYVATCDI